MDISEEQVYPVLAEFDVCRHCHEYIRVDDQGVWRHARTMLKYCLGGEAVAQPKGVVGHA